MEGLVSRSWGIWLSVTVLVTAGIEIISREYIYLHTIVVSCNFRLVQEKSSHRTTHQESTIYPDISGFIVMMSYVEICRRLD